jgi:hypothetical protein
VVQQHGKGKLPLLDLSGHHIANLAFDQLVGISEKQIVCEFTDLLCRFLI